MKPLFRAMSSAIESFIPPQRGEGFENVCLDVFQFVLKKRGIPAIAQAFSTAQAHGVSGDSQAGIDIFDPSTLAVAQCKHQKNLYPRDLTAEAHKFLNYDGRVSHYFFLIGQESVKRSLQDWVRNTNRHNQQGLSGDDVRHCQPSGNYPTFHIVGWGELKGYLLESNFLMWKWGLAHPVIHQYPYLPSLDVKFLVEAIDEVKNRVIKEPAQRASKDAVAGMLQYFNIDALSKLTQCAKVPEAVFGDLHQFITEWYCTLRIAETYQAALRDVNSRDPIIMERGFVLMNELARHLPRISVLGYLSEVRQASEELLNIFQDGDSHDWEDEIIVVNGEKQEVDGSATRIFNFLHTDWTHPYYIDPHGVDVIVDRLVTGIKKARAEVG